MLLGEGAWLVMQMWPDGRRPQALWSLGAIWKYWGDVSGPGGGGEAPVEQDSGERETEDLCKATLIGPSRKMTSSTWVIVPTVHPVDEGILDHLSVETMFLSQTHCGCCSLNKAFSLLHPQKPDLP